MPGRPSRTAGIDPSDIVLEVTETRRLERETARTAFEALRAIGFRVALDDFGSRYAVLSELVELPVDAVKLDRAFVASLGDARRLRFLAGLVGALSSLGLDIIAEGIETVEDEQVVGWAGVRHAQGYLFGRPVAALDRHQPVRDDHASRARRRLPVARRGPPQTRTSSAGRATASP